MTRGILASCHVRPTRPVTQAELDALYAEAYRDEPFVRVVADPPATKHVYGSNQCRVWCRVDPRSGRILALGVIDNLVKGGPGSQRRLRSARDNGARAVPGRTVATRPQLARRKFQQMQQGAFDASAPAAGVAGARNPAGLEPLPIALPPVEERAVLPGGFRAGGTVAGIKPSGRPDLAIIATLREPAAAAAVFTRNQVVAAPIRVSRAHLNATEIGGGGRFGWADAIVATSGSANAATGADGDADEAEICKAVAAALQTRAERTLAMSTGVIGVRLPVAKVSEGIARLVPQLSAADAGLEAVARAMMTTDTKIKLATTTLELPGRDGAPVRVTVSGIAKGVGMIHPRMATMLSVILTDAAVAPDTLYGLLTPIVQRTWNQLSVDGDTSTNDTVFLLASGACGAIRVATASDEAAILGRGIEAVARSLARQQAADGPGRGPAGRRRGCLHSDHLPGERRRRRPRRQGDRPLRRQQQPPQGRRPRP